MAHNKLYVTEIIKEIQNAVNNNKVLIIPYKDYSFLSLGINSCSSTIHFYIDSSTGKKCKLTNLAEDLTTELYSIWKQYPANKFVYKDWKNDTRDFVENTIYSEIRFTTTKNEVLRVLIRKLDEVYKDGLSEQEKLEFAKENCDLVIDGRFFTVIKIQKLTDKDDMYWTHNDIPSYIKFSFDSEYMNDTTNENDEDIQYNDNTNELVEEALF